MPQIEVKFDIDANGILNVSAKDLGTGKEQKVRIERSGGLSPEEVERMKRDAQSHAEEDKKKRELVEHRNKIESLSYETEKLSKEHGDKLGASDKTAIDMAVKKARDVAKGTDVAAMKAAFDELQQATHALSKAMYEKSAAAGGAPGTASGPEPAKKKEDDDVVDADFEVKK
jgi:molecular chaperone DnaK